MHAHAESNQIPSFPLEITTMIIQSLPRSSLPAVLQAHSVLYVLACEQLYSEVTYDLKAEQRVELLKTLSIPPRATSQSERIPLPSSFVRTLHLDFSAKVISANLSQLIYRALSSLPLLRELYLYVQRDSGLALGWILEGCIVAQAQLHTLSTSLRCDVDLSRFLEKQPSIVNLGLRGFAPHQSVDAFALHPTALPRLSSFTVFNPLVPCVSQIAPKRSIERASFTLLDDDSKLDVLTLSTKPVKRLTLVFLGLRSLDMLVGAVAARMPRVEHLDIMVYVKSCTMADLFATTPHLEKMPELNHLMLGVQFWTHRENDLPNIHEDEIDALSAWKRVSPALQTVILPSGFKWIWQAAGEKWICSTEGRYSFTEWHSRLATGCLDIL